MTSKRGEKKSLAIVLMAVLVMFWGFDYIVAKDALASLSAMELLWVKYCIALVVEVVVMKANNESFRIVKHDIITFASCALFGELLYNYCELSALDYVPVSMVTIVLALVPIFTMLAEWLLFRKKATFKMVTGAVVCIIGVMFILGVDLKSLLAGGYKGYLLSLCACISWVFYNLFTDKLSSDYSSIRLTFNQLLYTSIMATPFALHSMDWTVFSSGLICAETLYLGIISGGLCFLIYVFGVRELGPTIPAVFSNFLPVSTALFGWIFLHEALSALQIAGGVIVIVSGCVVIIEKGKLEESENG